MLLATHFRASRLQSKLLKRLINLNNQQWFTRAQQKCHSNGLLHSASMMLSTTTRSTGIQDLRTHGSRYQLHLHMVKLNMQPLVLLLVSTINSRQQPSTQLANPINQLQSFCLLLKHQTHPECQQSFHRIRLSLSSNGPQLTTVVTRSLTTKLTGRSQLTISLQPLNQLTA